MFWQVHGNGFCMCSKDQMGCASVRYTLRCVLRTILIVINNIYAIGAYLWWTNVLRPLRWIRADCYYAIEGTMYKWLQENVAYWLWTAGYTGTIVNCLNIIKLL